MSLIFILIQMCVFSTIAQISFINIYQELGSCIIVEIGDEILLEGDLERETKKESFLYFLNEQRTTNCWGFWMKKMLSGKVD